MKWRKQPGTAPDPSDSIFPCIYLSSPSAAHGNHFARVRYLYLSYTLYIVVVVPGRFFRPLCLYFPPKFHYQARDRILAPIVKSARDSIVLSRRGKFGLTPGPQPPLCRRSRHTIRSSMYYRVSYLSDCFEKRGVFTKFAFETSAKCFHGRIVRDFAPRFLCLRVLVSYQTRLQS